MAMQKISIGALLALTIAGIFMSLVASGALVAYQKIPNTGTVTAVGVGVYWNSACTSNVTSIDWGTLTPSSTVSKMIYIKNEGNKRISLSMTMANWNPTSASKYITLTWNRQGTVLEAGQVVQATLVLSVSPSITGVTNFSFEITITGTEY